MNDETLNNLSLFADATETRLTQARHHLTPAEWNRFAEVIVVKLEELGP